MDTSTSCSKCANVLQRVWAPMRNLGVPRTGPPMQRRIGNASSFSASMFCELSCLSTRLTSGRALAHTQTSKEYAEQGYGEVPLKSWTASALHNTRVTPRQQRERDFNQRAHITYVICHHHQIFAAIERWRQFRCGTLPLQSHTREKDWTDMQTRSAPDRPSMLSRSQSAGSKLPS
eukprot:2875353-Rhodomonas_salina.3